MSASFHVEEIGLDTSSDAEVPSRGLPTLPERLAPWRDELDEWFQRPHPSTSASSVPGFLEAL